jgi:hypothetical protein
VNIIEKPKKLHIQWASPSPSSGKNNQFEREEMVKGP